MGKSNGNRYGEEFRQGAIKPVLENKQIVAEACRNPGVSDNARAESFFSTIKMEMIYPKHYAARAQAQPAKWRAVPLIAQNISVWQYGGNSLFIKMILSNIFFLAKLNILTMTNILSITWAK